MTKIVQKKCMENFQYIDLHISIGSILLSPAATKFYFLSGLHQHLMIILQSFGMQRFLTSISE